MLGPGLERLCFHLLLAKGYWPRYFGRNGQAQYGVDLIVSTGERCDVYQCKNVAEFSPQTLLEWLGKFEDNRLVARPHLPRPDRFVVVRPLRFADRDEIEVAKEQFYQQHRVKLEYWHREVLDAELAKQPDIVADLFSEACAERFCHLTEWNQGLFRPVKENSGDRRAIDRFLELKRQNRIIREEAVAIRFKEEPFSGGAIVVAGRSGSGKTITALDLATSLDESRWRVFYVSMRHQASEDHLAEGIKRRSSRPTIFVIDDAHLDLDKVDHVLDRIGSSMVGGRVRVVVVLQSGSGDEDVPGVDEMDVIKRYREEGLVLDLVPDTSLYGESCGEQACRTSA